MTCEYGDLTQRCSAPATTKRQRPAGEQTWDVCAYHAAFLDRLRKSIRDHSELLAKLRDS